jgi:hypothetical protein
MLLTSPATDRFVRLAVQTARMSEPVAKTRLRNASHESDARLLMTSGAARCLKSEDIAAGRRGQIPIEIAATPSPTSRGFLLQRLADAGPVSVAASVLTGVRGRDGCCQPPPAQIRTSPIRAYGSYLEYLTAKRC